MGRRPTTGASEADFRPGSEPAAEPAASNGSSAGPGLGTGSAPGDAMSLTGAPLAKFPGPAVIAGPNGVILDANAAGEPIAQLLRGGGGADLRAAIAGAQQGRPGQVNPLLLNAEGSKPGAGLAFDVAVLPWGEGPTVLLLARDITLERSLRAALIESRQRYKDLVEAASDFAWETDTAGCITFVSAGGALGYSAAQLVGTPVRELEHSGLQGESPFTTRTKVVESELWLRQADGEAACLLATALPLYDSEGEWRGARGLCRNVTAERQQEARLASDRHRERLLAYILGILRDEMDPAQVLSAACNALIPALPATGAAVYRLDPSGQLLCAAQAGGLPGEDGIAELVRGIGHGEDEIEIALESADGPGVLYARTTRFQESWNGMLCLWRLGAVESWSREDRRLLGEVAGQIGLTNQQVARQEELEKLSSTDPLTGLHNRRSFLGELERRCSRRAAWRGGAALFFIDLDNFKAANDRHGHQHGDRVLVTVARILREQTRSRDLVARLGGDEFALFVEDIGPSAASHRAASICSAVAELRDLSGDEAHPLGCSVGVAFCAPDTQENAGDIVERADAAMYRVKHRGKGGIEIDEITISDAAGGAGS
jgi:diguanylate cyclase (GGDEF)-like protein/PAS domain S-box-containing protein